MLLMKKRVLIVLVMTMLVMSSQLCFVHSRVLGSEGSKTQTDVKGASSSSSSSSSLRMATFDVSYSNSSIRKLARSLAYRLASGPSKKGPGH
ncbi:hypothetical protein VNO77_32514 [Canavalia gladiata]|uniref:Uncharacterized protein n=1 Tax=Canavalia gladiata TaxID=3824 RepID=A0AAN9KRD0_CANGL